MKVYASVPRNALMPHDKPIGIDLGTTNSAMACVDSAGRSAMIPNAEGEFITPSVVYFSESEVIVGKNARTAITEHPDLVAQWVKRDMGSPFYSHPIHGQYLPPEVIQACILRKLKADLVHAVGGEIQTVITVPAYFDEMRRKATADAGEMAGLRILDIVNEPTAAAIAFGEALGYLDAAGTVSPLPHSSPLAEAEGTSPHPSPLPVGEGTRRQDLNVLVYDLGGGTFDVTLLRLTSGKVQTLATDGDVQLGGHDWDQRLVDHLADAFANEHKLDPRQDAATLNRLFIDAMEAKHTLTARSRTAISVNYRELCTETTVTREQFEELTADLLERTAFTSRQVLAAAGLEWKDLQRVLLVGGSTRMPMVGRMLQNLTGIQPDRTVNPDEAVARGAALYASHLLAERGGLAASTFHVTNVNAHSLGIEGIETDTLRKRNVVLIPRNTPLPARHTERFGTKIDGQRSIVIKILEGESPRPDECIAIGRTVVRDLPGGLPKGWPVDVTFEYGTNGRLAVEAQVPGTQHQSRLELVRETGLSSAGLSRWKLPIESAGGIDVFEAAVMDILDADPDVATASGGNTEWGPAQTGTMPVPALVVSPSGGEATNEPREEETPTAKPARRPKRQRNRRIPLWLERLIGHVVSMLIFGFVGYLIISHFRPDVLPEFFGHRPQTEQKQSGEPR